MKQARTFKEQLVSVSKEKGIRYFSCFTMKTYSELCACVLQMMAPPWLVLVVLVTLFLSPQVKLCDLPEGNTRLVQSFNLKLLRTTFDASGEPNPSVYVGLRLSEDHSLAREAEYLQRLKTSLRSITSSSKSSCQEEPSTGILALHLLALKASCEDLGTPERKKLFTRLKCQLHEDKKQIVTEGDPKSNYYQYSLGILALCINDKKVDVHVIQKLLNAEEQNKFGHGETTSIDTEAMAGLALLCLKRSRLYPEDLTTHTSKVIRNVKEKIVMSQSPEGALGNIYSTPLAVQFLYALGTSNNKQKCSKAVDALLEAVKQGKFSNPMMMSQLMPVLHHKSYLDVAKIDCFNNQDNLFLSLSPGVTPGEDFIHVQLSVEGTPGLVQHFTQVIQVPSRSSLLDILKTAQNQNSHFTFETQDTLSGAFLTSVNGVKASLEERTYWQLLKHPNISLIQGIAEYKPEDGEHIILRLSKW
ncbi:transcobalamin-2 isoform X1 [Ascaphus truei]|uniref:transcobalamin-2 isoform X1 n=2 Tax=Ascaphus truei TaxID=8439 RepID=UPI003F5A4ACE